MGQQLHHGLVGGGHQTQRPAAHAEAPGRDHFLGTLFLVVQVYEYVELVGVFSEASDERPFSGHLFATTFFLLTGFHAAHVLVGLIFLGCVAVPAATGRYSAENYVALDIAGLFWHFVDWVWVAVFTSVYLI